LLKATGARGVALVVVFTILLFLLGAMIAGWGVWFLIGRGVRRFISEATCLNRTGIPSLGE